MNYSFALLALIVSQPEPGGSETNCQNAVSALSQIGDREMNQVRNETTWRDVVRTLKLKPLLPEGGYYAETYRSVVEPHTLMSTSNRPAATAILYLVTGENFSAFHRLKFDEIYHHYSGKSVELHLLYPNGELKSVILGSDLLNGEIPQFVVPAGVWQASKIKFISSQDDWALLGTTMAPGFDFADFELADRRKLLDEFPEHAEKIQLLTREP